MLISSEDARLSTLLDQMTSTIIKKHINEELDEVDNYGAE